MELNFHKKLFILVFLISLFFCHRPDKKPVSSDLSVFNQGHLQLKRILENGKVVAAINYNATNYFIYRGEPMGYQYELLKSFAGYLGVKLEVKIINEIEESFDCVEYQNCDIIATGLTVTRDRSEIIDFTDPILQTRQMLVQKKPSGWRSFSSTQAVEKQMIRNPLDLGGKTIYIQKNSSFKERLKNLSHEIGKDINIIEHPTATVEELIIKVNNGDIEYTVADEQIANVHQKFYPDIDVNTAISFNQNIAWAVRKGSKGLLDTINSWVHKFQKTPGSTFLFSKYFKNDRTVNIARSDFHSITGGSLSPYDQIIKEYSRWIGWDWRLLASLIYQESKFYPEAKSWAGAFGLMQLMPHTAEKFGVDSLSSPEEQIKAGVQFIQLLNKQFETKIEDPDERTKFVLASYNAGIAHVYDARRLAEKYNKDPNKWDKNVDFYLLNKSKPEYYNDSVVKYGYCRGDEPFQFVNEIIERYEHYKNVIVQ